MDRNSKVPLTAGNIMGKIKSVRFECDYDQCYSSSYSKNTTPKIPEKAGESNLLATSHNLTSLKLSDEIQTHGTIFPANKESTRVHACKVKTEIESPLSVTCGKLEDSSASVSPWVKQSEEKSNNNMTALSTITSRDRPIIGMVAAHWNEKEQSQISPKWWDGNGIPNSTNKYKEVPVSCLISTLLHILNSFTFLVAGPEGELARNTVRGETGESTFRRRWPRFYPFKVYSSHSLTSVANIHND